MKKIILFFISPLLLVISILFSNLSENDKAPIFILFMLGIIGLIFVVSGIISLISKQFSDTRFLCLGAFLTLLYVIVVIFLSRSGIIDSQVFLGFR